MAGYTDVLKCLGVIVGFFISYYDFIMNLNKRHKD